MRSTLTLACLVALTVLGCGSSPRPATRTVSLPDSATVLPIDAAGLRRRVADGRARVTLVNMWATWCGPCREEFPALVAAARRHEADGVRLLLVSADFDDQLPEVRQFLAQHGVRDTCFIKAEADMPFIDGVHHEWTGALPATLLYDDHGRLLDFWEGDADSARFERAVRTALRS
jgi:thiol-disulfide isomerase/thioredoxin